MPALDFSILLRDDAPQMLARGVALMLELTVLAWLLAMRLGVVLAMVRMSRQQAGGRRGGAWVEYHQNVPTLVQMMLWYFGIASLLPSGPAGLVERHDGEFAVRDHRHRAGDVRLLHRGTCAAACARSRRRRSRRRGPWA